MYYSILFQKGWLWYSTVFCLISKLYAHDIDLFAWPYKCVCINGPDPYVYVLVSGYWPLGHIMCNIWSMMDVFCCSSSILHMCTISIDRYIAISHPLRHKRQPQTRRGIIVKICMVWACAAALSSPLCIMGFLKPGTVLNNQVCAVTNIHFMIYGSVVAFFIPLSIVVVMYSLTTYVLYKKARLYRTRSSEAKGEYLPMTPRLGAHPRRIMHDGFERDGTRDLRADYSDSSDTLHSKAEWRMSNTSIASGTIESSGRNSMTMRRSTISSSKSHSFKQLNTEQRASKVLGLVFTAFVAGWTPFFVVNIIVAICPDCEIDDRVFIICTWVGWASSMVNPFIYTAFNLRFRQAFIRYLTCHQLHPLSPSRLPSSHLPPPSPLNKVPPRRLSPGAHDPCMFAGSNNLWTLPEMSHWTL